MKNLVGNKIPSHVDVEKVVRELQAIADKLARFTISLTTDERKRTLKFRPGGERIVTILVDISTREGLDLPKATVQDMKNDLELIGRLQPISDGLAELSRTISDTILQAQHECWWAATAYYSALQRLAIDDAKIEEALKPVVEFFAQNPRNGSSSSGQDGNGGNGHPVSRPVPSP